MGTDSSFYCISNVLVKFKKITKPWLYVSYYYTQLYIVLYCKSIALQSTSTITHLRPHSCFEYNAIGSYITLYKNVIQWQQSRHLWIQQAHTKFPSLHCSMMPFEDDVLNGKGVRRFVCVSGPDSREFRQHRTVAQ